VVPVRPLVATEGSRPSGERTGVLGALIAEHLVQWRLLIIVGRPGDPTNDPTLPGPVTRQRIEAGTASVARAPDSDADNIITNKADEAHVRFLPEEMFTSDGWLPARTRGDPTLTIFSLRTNANGVRRPVRKHRSS
jgi:hypothetical protein